MISPLLKHDRLLRRITHIVMISLTIVSAAYAQKLTITDLDVSIVMEEMDTKKDTAPLAVVPQTSSTLVDVWRDKTLNRAVTREAGFFKIDPLLIHALIEQESGGRARARSPKGAVGVMQLMLGTGLRFGVRNRYSVEDNVRGGVSYLAWLLDFFQGDVTLALAAYNAGEGAVMKYGKRIPPYRETQNYVLSIARRYKQLRDNPLAALERRSSPSRRKS